MNRYVKIGRGKRVHITRDWTHLTFQVLCGRGGVLVATDAGEADCKDCLRISQRIEKSQVAQ